MYRRVERVCGKPCNNMIFFSSYYYIIYFIVLFALNYSYNLFYSLSIYDYCVTYSYYSVGFTHLPNTFSGQRVS